MSIIICPGMHKPELTQGFLTNIGAHRWDHLVFPTEHYPAYSAVHILDFLRHQFGNPLRTDQSLSDLVQVPLVFIGFSAGVVGAIGAAWLWRLMGGNVKVLIALDGWGVPLYADFPIHRVSHDYFSHWSASFFGGGADSFYVDPPIMHLELWRSPHTAYGYWTPYPLTPPQPRCLPLTIPTTAADFIHMLLVRYEEI